MKIIIAGVGPGKADLISLAAVNAAKESDLILVPRSGNGVGVAEKVISQNVPDKLKFEIFFPMIKDSVRRSEIIREQISKLKSQLEKAIQFYIRLEHI